MHSLRKYAAYALLIAATFGLSGCMDMFDPSGGSYARNRFVDPDAFALSETRTTDDGMIYVFAARKPAGEIKMRSVYLFTYLAPERRNGPNLKFEMDSNSQLVVSIKKADIMKFSGLTIFGDYKDPAAAITGARSVNILQEVYFQK
jgi:hypothetical protein